MLESIFMAAARVHLSKTFKKLYLEKIHAGGRDTVWSVHMNVASSLSKIVQADWQAMCSK